MRRISVSEFVRFMWPLALVYQRQQHLLGGSLQIEIAGNDSRPNRIHVASRFFGSFGAFRATKVMLFKACQFRFVRHPAKVITFQVVVREMGSDGATLGE